MKIVMLGHKRIPSREGGVEIVVEQLCVRMAKRGHEVVVYNRGDHPNKLQKPVPDRKKYYYQDICIKTIPTPRSKSLNAIVYAFLATLKTCFMKTDIVHFHAEGPCSMIPLAKLFGKRCIATIHGLDWKRAKWGGFAKGFLLFGEKMAAKYADEIIVLSKGVQKYFMQTYGRNTHFIPNGITQPVYRKPRIIFEKYGLKENEYLLFLARLVPEKGVHTLLNAYRKSEIDLPLVIAGGSSHSDDYEKKIREMAQQMNDSAHGKIIMTGFVEGSELEELYSNCLLYILPSEIEGMPLSLLEAMSYGNLCLTSNIAENMDVTDGHGLAFQMGNENDLCLALKDAVDNNEEIRSETRFFKEEISQSVFNRYNWDHIVDKTLEIYKSKRP